MKDTNAVPQNGAFFASVDKLASERQELSKQTRQDIAFADLSAHPGWSQFKDMVEAELAALSQNARGVKPNEDVQTCLLRKLTVEAVDDIITGFLKKVDATADYLHSASEE